MVGAPKRMAVSLLLALSLASAAVSYADEPLLENERVIVWDTSGPAPAIKHDYVAVSLSQLGTASFGHPGEPPSRDGGRTIVVELKDKTLPPISNASGFPAAFPRPYATELFENNRVVVWNVMWPAGEATPMHFHDKDAVAVFESTGALQSATPDGKATVDEHQFAEVIFAPRNRTHSEMLRGGKGRAIIIELK